MYIYKIIFHSKDKEQLEFVFSELNNQQIDCIDYRFLFRLVCCMELESLLAEPHQAMMQSMLVIEEQSPLFTAHYLINYPAKRVDLLKIRCESEGDLSWNEFIDLQYQLLTNSIEQHSKPIFFQYSQVEKVQYLIQLVENGSETDFYSLLEYQQLQNSDWDTKEQKYLDELDYIRNEI